MTTLALLIIVVSLAVGGSMAAMAAQILRNERRRSDARVALLSQLAGPDFLSELDLPAPLPAGQAGPDRMVSAFDSRWGVRLAITGALSAIVLIVVFIAILSTAAADTTAPPSGTLQAAQAGAAPLELMALGHTRDESGLRVSGRVQNPASGQPASELTATVFLFGPDGAFLTSGRSPLDVRPLGAGAESAFVVTIPVNGPVARYRVSFRDGTGRAVSHIDRRAAPATAGQ